MNGKVRPGEVRAATGAADEDVRVVLGLVHLHLRLFADHGLVHQDVVEHRAERVLRVLARRGRFDGLGDRDAEAARSSPGCSARIARPALVSSDGLATTRPPNVSISAAPVRLLVVRHPDHADVDLEAEDPAREGERRAPLTGARLGREALDALLLVVVRLRDGGVRLVRAGRRDALVLVVDARRRLERLSSRRAR